METFDMELLSSETTKKDYDYFIIAPNIEKRSRSIFDWAQSSVKCEKYILANYSNFHTKLSKEQEDSFFSDFKYSVYSIIDAEDDGDLFRKLKVFGIDKNSKVGLDITGFSIPSVYGMMYFLKKRCGLTSVDVYYTEPQNYVYEEGYFDSYHPDNSFRACAPIAGYINSGKNQSEILTIFLGFDGGLADLVYGKLGEEGKEILRTIAVNGFPSYTAKLKDVSLYNNESLIDKLDRSDRMTTTANNPFDTYNLLCKIRQECKDILINICTIGSKPMALGACLYALDNKESVKVTYPYYIKTNFDILEQPGKMWRYGVIFA